MQVRTTREARIERLFNELRDEIVTGLMQGELPNEELMYTFEYPVSQRLPNHKVLFIGVLKPVPTDEKITGIKL